MVQMNFSENERIIRQGDDGDSLFIIKEGVVSCRTSKNIEVRQLFAMEILGENSILFETKRSLDVFALKDCVLYKISKDNLKESLGPDYKDIILYSIFKENLLRNKFFSSFFSENQLYKMFKIFSLKNYKKMEIVFPADCNVNKKIIIIIQGGLVDVRIYIKSI